MITSLTPNERRGTEPGGLGWSLFDRLHLMLPFLAVVLGLMLEYSDLDLWLEGLFYDPEQKLFPWRENWLFAAVLHEGGRTFFNLVGLSNVLGIIGSFLSDSLAPYRKLLVCLLLAMVAGPVLVGLLKDVTHIYSPWDLAYFGGRQEYVKLLDKVPQGAPVGHAFPAGHASGGFALVATYFALAMVRPSRRFWGLGVGLGLGFIFGFAQQVRGAHFLSHDFFSLAVCWSAALVVFFLFYGKRITESIDPSFA